MTRKFTEESLIIASHNAGKVREIAVLLEDYVSDVTSAAEHDLPEPVEDGLTFIENAIIKAKAGAAASGRPVLADDSGLCVHVLDNAPGISSARWGGEAKDFDVAMERVREELGDAADRTAHFACALALAWPDGHVETVEGHAQGDIVWPPQGDQGFGYDPIFQPSGYDITFAQMDADQKKKLAHRTHAFKQLVEKCFQK